MYCRGRREGEGGADGCSGLSAAQNYDCRENMCILSFLLLPHVQRNSVAREHKRTASASEQQ